MANNNDADILGQLNNNSSDNTNNANNQSKTQEDLLKSMNDTLTELLRSVNKMSQIDARDKTGGKENSRYPLSGDGMPNFRKISDDFYNSFERSLIESVIGSDFKDKISDSFKGLAKELGVDVDDIGKVLGKELGKQVTDGIRNTKLGKTLTDKAKGATDKLFNKAQEAYNRGKENYMNKAAESAVNSDVARDAAASAAESATVNAAQNIANGAESAAKAGQAVEAAGIAAETGIGAGASAAGAAASGILSLVSEMAPPVIAATAAFALLSPVIESLGSLFKAFIKSGNRNIESMEANQKAAQKRINADIETLAKKPFEILEAAAQKVYDAWDNSLRTINATQGYTKADLQDLLASYAERIRDENLSSVISGADITENLTKVLQSGLSGTIAEEFSYIATKLNAAIPTQDFFNYADTYASLAATAVQNGASQSEAIEYANSQLELFASNLLYSSRQLTGGFSTGLSNAEALFKKSAQIAQASKTANTSEISGVLTAISASVGAVAPDLADSLVDAVYNAAVGGNSSEIVALRSLAGINASNTEFLKQLSQNPKKVLSDLFDRLAELQNMSNDNYMEVAEGLSSVFGVSMDALARVDFKSLATSINRVDVSTKSLEENMKLLASGETTTNEEQLKMQQINKYLIDEGLSYVLDNEVARTVQQHMWDEQLAREMQETTYGVELQGSSRDFFVQIIKILDIIKMFVNPIGYLVDKVQNVTDTSEAVAQQSKQLKEVLEKGKVGNGNAEALNNLLTTNKDLNLIPDIATLLGGTNQVTGTSHGIGTGSRSFLSSILPSNWISNAVEDWANGNSWVDRGNSRWNQYAVYKAAEASAADYNRASQYKWGSLSKSMSAMLTATASSTASSISSSLSNVASEIAQSATEKSKQAMQQRLDRMLDEDYIKTFTSAGKTYDEWVASANKFGINSKQFTDALKTAGYDEADVKQRFESYAAEESIQQEQARRSKEEEFWANMQDYSLQMIDQLTQANETLTDVDNQLIQANYQLAQVNTNLLYIMDPHLNWMEGQMLVTNDYLNKLLNNQVDWMGEWVDYFIKHVAYNRAYDYSDVKRIQQDEKSEQSDAIYALADALTQNTVDLLDPTVQTNALLSQILIVVNNIMQQNNTLKTNISLPDTLAALSTGLTTSI